MEHAQQCRRPSYRNRVSGHGRCRPLVVVPVLLQQQASIIYGFINMVASDHACIFKRAIAAALACHAVLLQNVLVYGCIRTFIYKHWPHLIAPSF